MSKNQSLVRSRFRAPNGQILLHGGVEGKQALHALVVRDQDGDSWSIVKAYRIRKTAERELAKQQLIAKIDCLIIDCEPF